MNGFQIYLQNISLNFNAEIVKKVLSNFNSSALFASAWRSLR